jgi:hypothetical protein
MKPLISLLLVLVTLSAIAAAQEAPLDASKPVFRTLGLGFSTSDLFYAVDDKDVPLPITEDSRSPFLRIPATGQLSFHRLEKLADGTTKRLPLGSVDLSRGGKMPLVLFSMTANNTPKIEVLDDSLSAFPGGSYRVINRLNEELGALFGKSPVTIPANSDRVIDGNPVRKGNTLFAQLYLISRNPRKLVFSNNWAFNSLSRTLVVVVPPVPPSDLPLVRRIVEAVDMLTPPEPSANPAP